MTFSKINVRDQAYLNGKMVESIMVFGREANNMVLVFIEMQKEKIERENGKMERESDG